MNGNYTQLGKNVHGIYFYRNYTQSEMNVYDITFITRTNYETDIVFTLSLAQVH